MRYASWLQAAVHGERWKSLLPPSHGCRYAGTSSNDAWLLSGGLLPGSRRRARDGGGGRAAWGIAADSPSLAPPPGPVRPALLAALGKAVPQAAVGRVRSLLRRRRVNTQRARREGTAPWNCWTARSPASLEPRKTSRDSSCA